MSIAKDLFYAQQALVRLFSVTNKLQTEGDKYLQDLTTRQMLAIPAIIHAPEGKATISYIAQKLDTTKQSAKQIVDAMKRKGYLSVEPSKLDRRAVDISITLEAEEAFKECSKRTDEFLADIYRDFTTEDLELLCMLLQKLYQFDGVEQEGFGEQAGYDESKANIVLKYHENFLKKRINSYE